MTKTSNGSSTPNSSKQHVVFVVVFKMCLASAGMGRCQLCQMPKFNPMNQSASTMHSIHLNLSAVTIHSAAATGFGGLSEEGVTTTAPPHGEHMSFFSNVNALCRLSVLTEESKL